MALLTLSDHLHDIAENSINAGAKSVKVTVRETENEFYFSVEDDAGGIRPDILEKIFDPFTTTRDKEIRRVGLGLPFLKQAAEATGGYVRINSELGKGTKTEVLFRKDHIDCQPVGDLPGVFLILLMNDGIEWHIIRCYNDDCYEIRSETIRSYIGSLDAPEKVRILMEFLNELENSIEKN
ncbi:ATP-binding protein [Fervidobacterium thailandense]|uniref:histidine kinase n=1 Tax=Fervidobacterium thailandense TaxID=1008305 RepID=A0A1E3G2L0_9BACT|nr:ATP-binding protein [Fervidobacterium thailandense]ODN29898.1 histidine kinase [Fervidobacterium thailandense]